MEEEERRCEEGERRIMRGRVERRRRRRRGRGRMIIGGSKRGR